MRRIAVDVHAILAASVATLALAPVASVHAQDSIELEEIIVMAQKRQESLQVVPIAATAVTGEALEIRFAKDFTDISGAIPNTTLELEGISNYSAAFYIRGQGVLNRGPFIDPAVAVVTDGVTDGRVNTAMQDFLDIEAVETLRGPQGTLQGRNATAGAILVRHYKPNVDEFEGNVGATLGNYGRHEFKGMINLPIASGTSAFRLAARYGEIDGFYRNAFDGRNNRIGGGERYSILPSIRFKTDSLDVTLRGDYAKYKDDAAVLVPLNRCGADPRDPANLVAGSPGAALIDGFVLSVARNAPNSPNAGPDAAYRTCAKPAKRSQYTVNQDRSLGDAELKVWGLMAEANYDIAGAGTVTYVGSYRDNHEVSELDVDSGPLPLFFNSEDTTHWQTSHELRFASSFSEKVDFVAGGLWFKQKYLLDRIDNFNRQTVSGQTNEQFGLFAHVNWHVTDALTAVLGGRYSKDKKDFKICGTGAVPCSQSVNGVPRTGTDSASWSDFSPRVGLNYKVNPDVFVYAYWARGFRAGGFNGEAANIQAAGPYDPEENNTYEAGFKADLLGDRLRLNGAVFYVEVKDLQRNISRVNANTGTVEIVTQNAATAELYGAELEATALITNGLALNLSLGWLDGKYKDFCTDINGTTPNDPSLAPCGPATVVASLPPPNNVLQPADESFLPLARAPKWTTRVNPTYKFNTGVGSVLLSAEWVYTARLFTNDQGAPNGLDTGLTNFDGTRIDPYRKATNIVNASITWRDPDERFKVSLYGKNLTREVYYRRLSFAAPTLSFGTLNDPREYGIEASYSF